MGVMMKLVDEIAREMYGECLGWPEIDDRVIDYAVRVAMAVIEDRNPPARWGHPSVEVNFGDNQGN